MRRGFLRAWVVKIMLASNRERAVSRRGHLYIAAVAAKIGPDNGDRDASLTVTNEMPPANLT